ncbi:MAG: PAS domain S-box protein [Syntrophothermus sp.]
MKTTKLFFFFIAIFFSTSLVFGVQSKELRKVKLQLKWHHQFQFAGYYAAKFKGFYAKEGLDVEILQRDVDKKIVDQIKEKKIDFATADTDMLLEYLQGASIKVLASYFQHSPQVILSLPENNIDVPSDLIGKKVVISSKQVWVEVRAMLLKEGIPLNRVHFVEEPWPIDNLKNKSADAILGYSSGEALRLKKEGIEITKIRPIDYGIDFYGDILISSAHETEEHPEDTKAFIKATNEGWEYAFEHLDETINYILSLPGVKENNIDRELLLEEAKTLKGLILPGLINIGNTNKDRWAKIANTYKSVGLYKGKINLDEFFFEPDVKKESHLIKIIIIILGVVVLVVLVAFLWIAQLKRRVNKKTEELQKEIEQRKETEELLKQEKNFFINIMNNIPDPIYFKDKENKFIRINKATAQGFGLRKPNDAIGKTDFDFFEDEHAKIAGEDEKQVLKTGVAIINKEEKEIRSNGKITWASTTKLPFKDEDGNIIGTFGISRDITEKKINEELILNSERKFKALFENSNDAILLMDENGLFECNQKTLEIYQHSKNEILGKSVLDFAPEYQPDGRTSKEIYAKLKLDLQKGPQTIEWLGRRKDGSLFYSEVNVNQVEINGRNVVQAIARDISERKLNEELIKQSESKFKTLFENGNDGIFLMNEKGFIDCNSRTLQLFKCSKEEIIGQHPGTFSPQYQPDGRTSREAADAYINEALNGKSQIFEWIHTAKDKTQFYTDISLNRVEINGKMLIQAIVRDISEKKKAEEIVKTYAEIFQNTKIGIAIGFTEEQCINLVNPALAEMHGYTIDELLGKQVSFLSNEESKIQIPFIYRKALKSGHYECEMVHKHKDGTEFPVQVDITIVRGNKNEILFVILNVQKITTRKEAEKIQTALYKISESVSITDDMDTLYRNIHEIIKHLMPAENFYIALYDEENEKLNFPYFVDKYEKEIPKGVDIGRGLTAYVLRTGKDLLVNEEMDLELRRKGEVDLIGEPTKIWLGVGLKLGQKNIGVLVVQDYENADTYGEREKQILIFVSEQIALAIDKKRKEEELKKYALELKELNANKDKFFSIIAHDLRSPFFALLAISELLSKEINNLSKEEIENLTRELDKALKNEYKLLENLLEWARFQTGRIKYQPANYNLYDEVDHIYDLLRGNIVKKKINFTNSVSQKSFIYADINMVHSIMQNLVSNAIKFSNIDGIIDISSRIKDDMMEISVKDNGLGIRTKDQEKLFKIDEQLTTVGTAQERGTGLGLILCKELVEKNGGTIWVESEFGKGSTFYFTLPLSD